MAPTSVAENMPGLADTKNELVPATFVNLVFFLLVIGLVFARKLRAEPKFLLVVLGT